MLTALLNRYHEKGYRVSGLARGIILATSDEFGGRSAWMANALLIFV